MNNTPDYNNNLAFAPGDWSDSRVVGNTDRTVSTIQLIEKIEELEKENKQLRRLLKECQQTNKVLVGVMDWLKVSAVPEQRDMCAKLSIGAKDIMDKIDEVMK